MFLQSSASPYGMRKAYKIKTLKNIFHSIKMPAVIRNMHLPKNRHQPIHKPQTSQQVHLQMRIYIKHQNIYQKNNHKISKK